MAISEPWQTGGHRSESWQGSRALFQPASSTRVCCCHALSQPEENAHVAGVRCPAPLVQPVGHLKQNPTQNMEMLSGIGSGVIIIVMIIFIVWLFPDFQIAIYMQAQALRNTNKGLQFEQ